VNALDDLGDAGGWGAGLTFTTAPLATPSANTPQGVASSNPPTFSWTTTTGGLGVTYDLWVDDLTTGVSQVIRNQSLTTTMFVPSAPLASGSYRWYIRALDSYGDSSAWSSAFFFTIS
jgi:hypothetical protein